MQSAKHLNETSFRSIGKTAFDPVQEELMYRKVINTLAYNALMPRALRLIVTHLLSEDIPFSEVQERIKKACDMWLKGFKVESTVEVISLVYQMRSLFSKVPFAGDDLKTTQAALDTLMEGEKQCQETNARFQTCFDTPGKWIDVSHMTDAQRNLIYRVRSIIYQVIGDFTSDKLEQVINRASEFGPGQTTEQRKMKARSANTISPMLKQQCSTPHKMSRNLLVTSSALPFVRPLLLSNHSWLKMLYTSHLCPMDANWWDTLACSMQILWNGEDIVRQVVDKCVGINNMNAVSVVPKSATTKRSISMENTINGVLQKSAGSMLKRMLHHYGINLYDQSVNQGLALEGSKTGLIATLDLKNASCTLAYNVVKLLLPVEWFTFLSCLRAELGLINFPKQGFDNKVIEYEQFSSMGNGFTFELESLIFAAITRAVIDQGSGQVDLFSVYGDDIICPSSDAPGVIEALNFFGFSINKDKTFTDGPFRESCGVDAYNGKNIRPVVLKRRCQSVVDLWFYMNRISYHCLDKQTLVLQDAYNCLWGFLRQEFVVPSPLTYAMKMDEVRDGKFVLDTDDLESGVKLPLSRALDYPTRVKMCRNGRIKYFRLRITQQYDASWHFTRTSLAKLIAEPHGLVTIPYQDVPAFASVLAEKGSTTLQVTAGLMGYQGGRVPLRGRITRRIKECITLGWESYPTDTIRRYFP